MVVTSSVAAIGPTKGRRPASEQDPYPESGTGLLYTDSKREGEVAAFEAGERLGIEVVAVNPSYVLGPSYNRSLPGETSTRIVGNYLRGRLPAIVDSYTNIVDVDSDVNDPSLGNNTAQQITTVSSGALSGIDRARKDLDQRDRGGQQWECLQDTGGD